ncbi:small ribosomal subunit biogenesis GTPase RsgA [Shewanella yunxiaonensis]|uniref:Small ribosomal subunit biogenesis GTPase RsgA n=1 Tax=Shewanella yunxiaonensis TaxID=2829809 RepID=A0ABX7YRV1_9GAMM|nr:MULTISPECIES: small ribosomal subunit biogenesis GTPase RsgA [Shewanella]MDF0534075.1 small ribosomal subunit biogenesis GTPase RsgA [Shewanella sp. A32]QUN05395.1 small ribosomal subunit biogenesis GTPase RsgA [Shewanella yunxiaonensis]
MSKKKLTHGQLRRMKANHEKRLQRGNNTEESATEFQDSLLGPEQEGTVISRFGQHADVETTGGELIRCNLRRTIGSLVCGDKVVMRPATDPSHTIAGVVEAVHPRRSTLTRPDLYDGVKVVAANIDQILIVSSVVPVFSTQIIDRYLVAAEDCGIPPVIVLNKIDLLTEEMATEIDQALVRYRAIGYQVYEVSSRTGAGIEELQSLLDDKVSIFTGQSGVGKSSLINCVLPDAQLLIGDVSDNSGLGQHTTTASRLLHLPSGGDLIDSPGVREFALWHLTAERVSWCFVEFRDHLGGCKFRDCKHLDDPGCRLREAVEQGKIARDRFNNYHRIIASLSEQRHARQFRAGVDDF